jgi:hypothetical protein
VLQSLKEFLLAKSEGNPFFLEELVQALVDQGVLRRNAGGGVDFKLAPTTTSLTVIASTDRAGSAGRTY